MLMTKVLQLTQKQERVITKLIRQHTTTYEYYKQQTYTCKGKSVQNTKYTKTLKLHEILPLSGYSQNLQYLCFANDFSRWTFRNTYTQIQIKSIIHENNTQVSCSMSTMHNTPRNKQHEHTPSFTTHP